MAHWWIDEYNEMKMNILFTCAGRRTYLLKYFKEELEDSGLIVGADLQLNAPALSAADIKVQVPRVYASNYVDKILGICKEYEIRLLISLNDLELPILSAAKARFDALGVKMMVSSPDVIDICFDKKKTFDFIRRIGLNCPMTFTDYDAAVNAILDGQLKFPLILKPRWGSGSIGLEKVEDLEELEIIYRLLKKKIQRSILKEASSKNSEILIQEMIDGTEYGLDIMNNLNGEFQNVSVKQKMGMRSGETDKAITVDSKELREIGKTIAKALRHIGNLDCDILEKEGSFYVIDLNPRFGGGYPFSHQAGVNLPKALIEWTKGNEVPVSLLSPRYGVASAKCDYLVTV